MSFPETLLYIKAPRLKLLTLTQNDQLPQYKYYSATLPQDTSGTPCPRLDRSAVLAAWEGPIQYYAGDFTTVANWCTQAPAHSNRYLTEEFDKTAVAVGLFILLLESAFVQLLEAESAHKVLWVELLGHGCDAAACDGLLAAGTQRAAPLVVVRLTVGLAVVIKEAAVYEGREALLQNQKGRCQIQGDGSTRPVQTNRFKQRTLQTKHSGCHSELRAEM